MPDDTQPTTTSEPATTPEPATPAESSSPPPEAGSVDEYLALKAAAQSGRAKYLEEHPEEKKAEEGDEPAAAPPPAAESKPDPAKAAPSELADDDLPIAKLLRAREKAQTERNDADAYRDRMRAEAESVAQAIIRDAHERARRLEAESEDRIRRRLDEQLSPEAVLAKQADAADPVVQHRRWVEGELAKRDAELKKRDEALEALAKRDQQRDEAARTYQIRSAEQEFLKVASKESAPFARALWTPAELLREAHAVLDEGRAVAEKRGENFACSDEDLARYLNGRAKARLLERRDELEGALRQVAGATGAAPQGATAKPARTLSATGASERRAAPKPAADMTEEEAERAMRAAARAARK